jgi:hypothetical protein
MDTTREHLRRRSSFLATATFDDRPAKLFDGLQNCRSAIVILQHGVRAQQGRIWSSGYRRWAGECRDLLFPLTAFTQIGAGLLEQDQFPKMAAPLQALTLGKAFAKCNPPLSRSISPHPTEHVVFYQESARYWLKATVGIPYYAKNGRVGAPAHGRYLFLADEARARSTCAILNSSLFYIYFISYGDCFHVSENLVTRLPIPSGALSDRKLSVLGGKLMRDLNRHAERKTIETKSADSIRYDEFRVGQSKAIIDEIDHVLARHYGFTEEELDFIINYDVKYRMGVVAEGDQERPRQTCRADSGLQELVVVAGA